MRKSLRSIAVAVAMVTAGLGMAAPASARSNAPEAQIVVVRDHGGDRMHRRHDERRHYRGDYRPRYERRHHRERFYEGRRHDRYSRHDRDYRRHHRNNGVVIRLN